MGMNFHWRDNIIIDNDLNTEPHNWNLLPS